jgi:hypothetical protein
VPIGQFFRGLTAYDLLGNLVPGLIVLIAVDLFLPSPWIPSSVGGYSVFVLTAFVLGGIVQEHASEATGSRENFERSIDPETKPDITDLGISMSESEPVDGRSGDGSLTTGQVVWRAVADPTLLTDRSGRGRPVEESILTSKIRQHIHNKYDIRPDSKLYGVLYRLMLSEVDSRGGTALAVRMQALRNFHRGTWVATWYASVLVLTALLVDTVLLDCSDFPIEFVQPGYSSYWRPMWQILFVTGPTTVLFRYLNEKRNRDFVEYLFTDYAIETPFQVGSEDGGANTTGGGEQANVTGVETRDDTSG